MMPPNSLKVYLIQMYSVQYTQVQIRETAVGQYKTELGMSDVNERKLKMSDNWRL